MFHKIINYTINIISIYIFIVCGIFFVGTSLIANFKDIIPFDGRVSLGLYRFLERIAMGTVPVVGLVYIVFLVIGVVFNLYSSGSKFISIIKIISLGLSFLIIAMYLYSLFVSF